MRGESPRRSQPPRAPRGDGGSSRNTHNSTQLTFYIRGLPASMSPREQNPLDLKNVSTSRLNIPALPTKSRIFQDRIPFLSLVRTSSSCIKPAREKKKNLWKYFFKQSTDICSGLMHIDFFGMFLIAYGSLDKEEECY